MSEVVRQRVSRVLDNSRTKEELRLYGTPLKARRFEILRLYTSPVLVIAPSPYQKEMAKQAKSLNQDTRLILP